MKRLRELEAKTPLIANAQRLLESIEAVPVDDARMSRVRRELDRPRGLVAGLRRLPAFTAAVLLLLFGTSAFAAVRLFEAVRSQRVQTAQRIAADAQRVRAHAAEPALAASPAAAPSLPTAVPDPIVPALVAAQSAPAAVSGADESVVSALAQSHGQRARSTAALHHGRVAAGRGSALHRTALGSRAAGRSPTSARGQAASVRSEQSAAAGSARASTQAPVRSSTQPTPERNAAAATPSNTLAQPLRTEPNVPVPVLATDEPEPSDKTQASDSALVHRALKALRRDGDPALAARLLARQQALHSQGPLAEETLALQIEASLQLHDGRARGFAQRYLDGYPSGRYRAVAKQALAEPAQ